MKQNNAEILKINTNESMDLKQMVEQARMKVSTEQLETNEAEEDARSLELELMEAQVTHEKKEEAERQGKDTSEKITELTG